MAGAHVDNRRRVVVVDDDRACADALAELFRDVGHRVQVAHDGLAALELALTEAADAFVLDIGLPHVDGYELARRVRAQHGREPKIIAVTGSDATDVARRAFESGFDALLRKPVDPADLLCALED
jgi:CheY-like chemotaxis protein